VSGLALVAGADAESEALFGHLAREWERGSGPGPCRRLAPAKGGVLDGPVPAVVAYAAGARSGSSREPVDLADAEAILGAAAVAGCRLVVLSSTEAVAPHHHHLGFVSERRFQPRPGGSPRSDAWVALEALAARIAEERGAALCVLRAAPAPVPGGRDAWSRWLSGPLAATVPGFDPSIQLLAMADLARAVALAARSPATGTFHVVPAGTVPVHRAVRLAGAHRLPVPRWLQRLAGRDLADFLRYPWTADGERARAELGFEAAVSSAQVSASFGREGGEQPGPQGADPGWEWGSDGFDRFGMDRAYVARYGRTLFRFLHDGYWRIEVRGLEHVPREGAAVLTGVHRGFMPYDGVMALHLLARERGRYPRFLLHPTLTKFPFLASFMTKLGGIPACRENADWVLSRGGLAGIFPEGIRGAFTPYRRAYTLGRMGRDEYVKMALANGVPILPFVTVGSAEIFPILARLHWPWWQRLTEWPCFPIAPPFPLLPVPLPSKWHTRFLEPLHVERDHGPEAADDPEVVRSISAEVRGRMEAALAEMLARRRHVFFGSVFEDAPGQKAAGGAGGAGG
jgi:1-acyl-sn-glycerol-3-phosphate acyltransferase/nucleoside-diphosphate-sugar epimerase